MVARKRQIKKPGRIALIALGLLIALSAWGMSNLTPVMISMAEARARYLAVIAINNAVSEVMGGALGYDDLVSVITDTNGQVTMLQANTLRMNDLASKAALTAQKNLREVETAGVSLPLGSALGIPLLGAWGPKVRVNVVLIGSVSTRFVTAFESAGINQTRHEISMEASMLMSIVVPTGANSVTVTTYVPVAESIIVGNVPQSYIDVPMESDLLNLVP